jgi:beta-glucanase (GH16 family)
MVLESGVLHWLLSSQYTINYTFCKRQTYTKTINQYFFYLKKTILKTMKKLNLFYVFLLFLIGCNPDSDIPIEEPDFEGYTLVWSEEFDGNEISTLNWIHELGDGTGYGLPSGWGNDELQLYTDASENSYIEENADGVSALVIAATEESPGNYRSGKLTTQGLQSFRYGKIDARIKLPTAQGMWPAFWMLGDNFPTIGWAGCGEIDIIELVGFEPDVVHGNIHYVDGGQNYADAEGDPKMINETFDQNYHNFSIEWTPTEIQWFLDEELFKTTSIDNDGLKEFDRSFYLILNVAVGGNWPGSPDATTTFPQKMYVDYIRYYSKNGFTVLSEPVLDVDEETVFINVPPNIAEYAFNESMNQFPNIGTMIFGAGGEPNIFSSGTAVDGDSAVVFSYPGSNWGGGWFDLDQSPIDLSAYTNGSLVLSINIPSVIVDAEIKLESVNSNAAVFLTTYTPTNTLSNGYVEYTIPLSDFVGLDFTDIKIPFALWNPVDAGGTFPAADVLIDNIHWVQ